MKFNMGCGRNKIAGWTNVDAAPEAESDEAWDLEQTPWPWPDGCADQILFNHSLEHMGGDPQVFLEIMKEVYRIAAADCVVTIHVPHPRHDDFINDPTHVRAITPAMMGLFDRRMNDEWERTRKANSPLARYTGVDFETVSTRTMLEEPYATRLDNGEISQSEVRELLRNINNVASEYRIVLRARKPS